MILDGDGDGDGDGRSGHGRLQPPADRVLRMLGRRANGCEVELDGTLLRDAATVLSARRQLDALLAQLAAQPFSPDAYRGLRAYLSGPADRALAAHRRVCAVTTVPGR
jgi:hypothetical protein